MAALHHHISALSPLLGKNIRILVYTAGNLPAGCRADQLHEHQLEELAEDVLDVVKSSPVPFDWDCSMYNFSRCAELQLRRYMPARVDPKGSRDSYGSRRRWTEEYLRQDDGKLVPSVGMEAVASVSAKFAKPTAQGKIPSTNGCL